jgi:S-methylmethionine-dependent homocysteine/selenocysteine methylase
MMRDIVLLDGGLGQEISLRYTGETHPLWSIKVMLEQPDIVLDVHRAFIQAWGQSVDVKYLCRHANPHGHAWI